MVAPKGALSSSEAATSAREVGDEESYDITGNYTINFLLSFTLKRSCLYSDFNEVIIK